jgi:hypothetical protein
MGNYHAGFWSGSGPGDRPTDRSARGRGANGRPAPVMRAVSGLTIPGFGKNQTMINENENVYLELEEETDRAAAILCAAFLDYELEKLLRRFFLDAKQSEELFNPMQPLSSFSARIKISYVLGLIDKDTYDDLNLVRRIRNMFARNSAKVTLLTWLRETAIAGGACRTEH